VKKNLWIFGALAALSLAAVAVVAQTSPAPAADDEGAVLMPGAMMGMRSGMGAGMGPGMCPPGTGMGMAAPGGQAMMRGRRGMGAGMAGRGMGLMRLQALNLTSDQWARVRRIQEDFQKQIIPKQSDIRVAQIELQQLLQATQPNMNQVNAKLTAIGNLRTQIQTLRTQELIQIRGVLTQEQLTKFLDPSWQPPCVMQGMQGPAPGAAFPA